MTLQEVLIGLITTNADLPFYNENQLYQKGKCIYDNINDKNIYVSIVNNNDGSLLDTNYWIPLPTLIEGAI